LAYILFAYYLLHAGRLILNLF